MTALTTAAAGCASLRADAGDAPGRLALLDAMRSAGVRTWALPELEHGTTVVTLRAADVGSGGVQRVGLADAVVTDAEGVACVVTAADCTAVLLADESAGVVGAVHAGWRGAVAGAPAATVAAMEELGARPERIRYFISPCISLQSFEVGEEVADAFEAQYVHRSPQWARPHVDLRGAVLGSLRSAGVAAAPCEATEDTAAGWCTAADAPPGAWYSHRRQGAKAGRLAAAIALIRPGVGAGDGEGSTMPRANT